MSSYVTQLFALAFSDPTYLKLAKAQTFKYEPTTTEQSFLDQVPTILCRKSEIRADLRNSLAWTASACALAGLTLFLNDRLSVDLPIALPKLLTACGTALAAWPTWFALANIEDTFDMDARLDLVVRKTLFKVLFFPGLALAFIGGLW